MMRQWMVDPRVLCRKHLLGEHVEHHMLLGTLRKKKSIQGYLDSNLSQPSTIYSRHRQLTLEMVSRGYNHRSPIHRAEADFHTEYLSEEQYHHTIDRAPALKDLLSRCPDCRRRYDKLNEEE